MSTFNETDHPRGQGGQWVEKERAEVDPGLGDEMIDSIIYSRPPETHDDLPDLGISDEDWEKETGFGRRNVPGCENRDTLANKYRAGALSASGVMGEVFGTDSLQHHLGHNAWGDLPHPVDDARPMADTEADGFTQERYGVDGPYIPGYSEVGFSRDEGFEWYRHNFGPSAAKAFSDAGITPGWAAKAQEAIGVARMDTYAFWVAKQKEGRREARAAARKLGEEGPAWVSHGFKSPTEALKWSDAGFDPEAAAEWTKVPRMKPEQAESWVESGHEQREVFDRMKWFSERQGQTWPHGDWPED